MKNQDNDTNSLAQGKYPWRKEKIKQIGKQQIRSRESKVFSDDIFNGLNPNNIIIMNAMKPITKLFFVH